TINSTSDARQIFRSDAAITRACSGGMVFCRHCNTRMPPSQASATACCRRLASCHSGVMPYRPEGNVFTFIARLCLWECRYLWKYSEKALTVVRNAVSGSGSGLLQSLRNQLAHAQLASVGQRLVGVGNRTLAGLWQRLTLRQFAGEGSADDIAGFRLPGQWKKAEGKTTIAAFEQDMLMGIVRGRAKQRQARFCPGCQNGFKYHRDRVLVIMVIFRSPQIQVAAVNDHAACLWDKGLPGCLEQRFDLVVGTVFDDRCVLRSKIQNQRNAVVIGGYLRNHADMVRTVQAAGPDVVYRDVFEQTAGLVVQNVVGNGMDFLYDAGVLHRDGCQRGDRLAAKLRGGQDIARKAGASGRIQMVEKQHCRGKIRGHEA